MSSDITDCLPLFFTAPIFAKPNKYFKYFNGIKNNLEKLMN